MFTSLDLLVIVCMGLAAATLLSLCLMFFLKNKTAKRICLYIVTAIGLYMSGVGIYIGVLGWFPIQMLLGAATLMLGIAALALDLFCHGDEKLLRAARIMGAIALTVGFANAILI